MAHNIEQHEGKAAAIFGHGQDAWHRLGATVAGAITAEEAMTVGHLGGWNVRKVALTAQELNDEGVTSLEVPDFYATVRTNPFTGRPEALGVVGNRYAPIQNEEHADLLNHVAHESGASFDTAGSLNSGREVFVTMQMPEHLMVGGVDRLDLNLVALNSHDGSGAFRFLVSPVRVVCANTQQAAIKDARATFSIRHTRNARGKVQEAREALGLTLRYVEQFETAAERMIQETMEEGRFWEVVRGLYGATDQDSSTRARNAERERTDHLSQLWHDARTQEGVRGTRWAAYQVVAEYEDHRAPARGRSHAERAQIRAQRAVLGTAATTKAKAWEALSV